MHLPETTTRVSSNTSQRSNERIRGQIRANIAYYAERPRLIPGRLRELDREWDIERALETGSASLTLTGLALGVFKDKRWLLLSLAVQGFFLQHALQGWCPPIPLFRRMGVRTAAEIEQERYALKALRGDFEALSDCEQEPLHCAGAAFDATQLRASRGGIERG